MGEPTAIFGWQVGTLCGLIFAARLVLAIASTPRLREHGGQVERPGSAQRWMAAITPLLCAGAWIAGAWFEGQAQFSGYAAFSAAAAAALLVLIVVPIMATAANHIARRSLW